MTTLLRREDDVHWRSIDDIALPLSVIDFIVFCFYYFVFFFMLGGHIEINDNHKSHPTITL